MNVSLFPSATDPVPIDTHTIDEILTMIKDGFWKDSVQSYRMMVQTFKKSSVQATSAKKALPAFTVSGTFERRSESGLIQHSGFVAIDIDDLHDINKAQAIVKTDPYIYASFVSVSENGLCLIVKVDPEQHINRKVDLFNSFKEYFEQRHDIDIDKLQDVSRLRFVSYDPEMFQSSVSRTFRIESEKLIEVNPNGDAKHIHTWDNGQKIQRAEQWTQRNASYQKGERHNYIRNLAYNSNRLGVPQSDLEAYVFSTYPHFASSPSNAITWVYKNKSNEHGILDRSFQYDSVLQKQDQPQQEVEDKEQQIIDELSQRLADWNNPVEEPPAIISIQGGTISTAGNITVLAGASKSGKSGVLNAIKAGTMAPKSLIVDTLGIDVMRNEEGLALIHIDTEQSRYNFDRNYRRVVSRAGLSEPPQWFKAYWLQGMSPSELVIATAEIARREAEIFGGVFMFVIDGIGDYVQSVNDDIESNEIVKSFMKLAEDHHCPMLTVLHFNPGSNKERGHIGSQLQRKAESIIKVTKGDNDVSTIGYKELRNAGRLTEMEFEWCDRKKMHVSLGEKPKPLSKQEQKTSELRNLAIQLIKHPVDKGVLLAMIEDELGCSKPTATRRMQDMIGRKIISAENLKTGPYWVVEDAENMPF